MAFVTKKSECKFSKIPATILSMKTDVIKWKNSSTIKTKRVHSELIHKSRQITFKENVSTDIDIYVFSQAQ